MGSSVWNPYKVGAHIFFLFKRLSKENRDIVWRLFGTITSMATTWGLTNMGPDQNQKGSFRKFPEVSGSFRKFPEVSANLLGKLFLKVLFSEQFLGGQPIVMIPFDAPL